MSLAAELAVSADFAGDAGDFAGEGVELVDHGVDGVFQLEDFAFHVDGDFAGEVAARYGRGDLGDVADLRGEVSGHGVDRVGEVLPGARYAGHDGLSAESAVGADFASHAGDFGGEGPQLVHHRVDGFFELQDFATHVHGDFAGEVAAGHRSGDFGDVADLAGQVAGHGVDRVGEIFPGASHAGDLRLASELAVGPDFASDARHFRGEDAQLLNHGVDDLRGPEEFTFERAAVDVEADGLRQVSLRDGGDGASDFGGGPEKVVDERVDGDFNVAPGPARFRKAGALASFPLFADDLSDTLQVLCYVLVGGDNVVERVGDFSRQAGPRARQAHAKIAVAHRAQAFQDDPELRCTLGARFGLPIGGRRHLVGGSGIVQHGCIAIGFLHVGLQLPFWRHSNQRNVSETGRGAVDA